MRKGLFGAAVLAGLLCQTVSSSSDELKPFVRGSWKAILSEHAGQPFVVHFWGLTCGPCRVELPEWGQLTSERKDLTLVTVNADLVQDAPAKSSAFLENAGLTTTENWLFADQFTQRLRFEINPAWQGEIPATLFIARNGHKTWTEGSADMDQVRAWLESQKTMN